MAPPLLKFFSAEVWGGVCAQRPKRADAPHVATALHSLLRLRRERPRHCASKARDELAPLH
jgi:hypothetical protein